MEEVNEKEVKEFIGENADKIYHKLYGNKYGNAIDNILWPAVFFTPLWFAYRKMYKMLIIILAVSFATGFIAGMMDITDGDLRGISFALQLIFGVMANFLYRKKIEKEINEIKKKELNEEQTMKEIRDKGGVSGASMAIMILFNLILYNLAG